MATDRASLTTNGEVAAMRGERRWPHAARKPSQGEPGNLIKPDSNSDWDEPTVVQAFRAKPLGRPYAVSVLIGTLGVSLGMIVCATIITVIFLV